MSRTSSDMATTKTLRATTLAVALSAATSLAWLPTTASAENDPAAAATPTPTPTSADEANKKLEARRAELENAQKRERDLQKDVTGISAQHADIKARMLETAALVQKSEAQITAIEARLAELDAQEKLLRGSLAQRHEQIARLLAALQRMGRNPPPVIITRREDALKMVRSAMLLATTFPEMRTQALALAGKLNDLVRIMADIRSEGDKLKEKTQLLNDTRTRLASLLEANKQSLAERQTELKQVRQATADISKSVTDLNDLITKLDQQVTASTGLGAYNKATEGEGANGTVANPTSPPASPPATQADAAAAPGSRPNDVAMLTPPPAAKPATPSVIELAPGGSSANKGDPDRMAPAIPFSLARTKLPPPAQGRRVLSFGDKTQYGGTSKGLVIETRFGAQVTSPCDGWIVYAGEFRSYGQLLIINAGGGYHVLIAGLSQIDVQPGQFVLAAEPVGTMSGAPRTAQLAVQTAAAGASPANPQQNSPVLYVEFRKDGQPIDPDPWWVVSNQKVQD